jgi:hypothetical protein
MKKSAECFGFCGARHMGQVHELQEDQFFFFPVCPTMMAGGDSRVFPVDVHVNNK